MRKAVGAAAGLWMVPGPGSSQTSIYQLNSPMMDVHTPATLVHLLLVCLVTKHSTLSLDYEYLLCPLPKLAD